MRRDAALHKKPSDINGNFLFSTGQRALQALSQNITRSLLGFVSDPLQVARSLEMFNFFPPPPTVPLMYVHTFEKCFPCEFTFIYGINVHLCDSKYNSVSLTFCMYIRMYVQRDAHQFFMYSLFHYTCSTRFGCYLHPSPTAQTAEYSRRFA
jgi:hypothetical protein